MKFKSNWRALSILTLSIVTLTPSLSFAANKQDKLVSDKVPKPQEHTILWDDEPIEIIISNQKYSHLKSLPNSYALLNRKNHDPYISLTSFFDHLLSYNIACEHQYLCSIVSIPAHYSIELNIQTGNVIIHYNKHGNKKGTKVHFKKNELFYKNNQVWIRYNLINKIIPMQAKWDISNYQITYKTDLPLYYIVKEKREEKRRKILNAQKDSLEKKAHESQVKPIKPHQHLGANFQYKLTHQESFSPSRTATDTGSYSILSDLLGGTFRSDGSVDFSNLPATDPSWTYTFMHKKYFHLLKFGDVNIESSLFMDNVSLVNGVQFDLNKSSDTSLSFRYENTAIPGTEIELWRGGFLVQTVTVGNDGRYTLYDANSEPGDKYRIKFYYPNGTEESRRVNFSPDKNLLLAKGKWDLNASYGTPATSSYEMGPIGSYLLRYGLTKTITLGLGHYDFNDIDGLPDERLNYLDLAWQIKPYWNINAQQMLASSDLAAQSTYTYFQKHFISIEYRQLDPSSDILKIPTVSGDYAATKRLLLEDKYTLPNNWRLISSYEDTNLDKEISEDLQARVSKLYSIDAGLGYYQPIDENTGTLSITFNNTFQFNKRNQLTAKFFWNKDSKDTETISYQYRNNYENNYSFTYSLNITHTGADGKIAPGASLSWNIGKYWSLAASANTTQYSISLSYLGAWSSINGFTPAKDFATGTLYGNIITPDTSEPLSHIKISAGGQSAETDKNGHYKIKGLPTYKKIKLKIEPEKAGLPYINSSNTRYVWFRPHTKIKHDFHLSELVGADGFVESNEALPDGVTVKAASVKTNDYWKTTVAKEDGFFAFEGLPAGTYQLTVSGLSEPPLPKQVTISAQEQWLSDIELRVPGYKPADNVGENGI